MARRTLTKMHQIKWSPLSKPNSLKYTTLMLGQNIFVYSKGPKSQSKDRVQFNPILHGGGGPADPPWRYISHDASVDGPMELKFHDFVFFFICYVPLRPFFKKNFEILKNRKNISRPFQHQRVPPLKKRFWKLFFYNFFV